MTKQPSLADQLAQKVPPAPAPEASPPPAEPPRERKRDDRITTTVRLPAEWLEALKIVAARKRVKVNDLLLEGAVYVLALNGHKVPQDE